MNKLIKLSPVFQNYEEAENESEWIEVNGAFFTPVFEWLYENAHYYTLTRLLMTSRTALRFAKEIGENPDLAFEVDMKDITYLRSRICLKTKKWEMHCADGPAIVMHINRGIYKKWAFKGQSHRTDGPAIEHAAYGHYEWFQHGELHREDGPALITQSSKGYFVHGKEHRLDGPSYKSNTLERWMKNGKPHRVDAPAVISRNGTDVDTDYYEDGIYLGKYAFEARKRKQELLRNPSLLNHL